MLLNRIEVGGICGSLEGISKLVKCSFTCPDVIVICSSTRLCYTFSVCNGFFFFKSCKYEGNIFCPQPGKNL